MKIWRFKKAVRPAGEFLRVTFGKVEEEEERQRVRQQLTEYCGLDTMGMVQIVRELSKL